MSSIRTKRRPCRQAPSARRCRTRYRPRTRTARAAPRLRARRRSPWRIEIWNICTKITPATRAVISAPTGCMTSEPAHTATRAGERTVVDEARIVLAGDQGSKDPAAHGHKRVHRDKARHRLRGCAHMTLKPNQPMQSNHDPIASQGSDDGGMASTRPFHSARAGRRAAARPRARSSRQRHGRRSSRRNRGNSAPRKCTNKPSWSPKFLFQADALEHRVEEADRGPSPHCGRNFARSAMPPETIAGIAAAKVQRKKNFTSPKPCGSKPALPRQRYVRTLHRS